MSGHMDRRTFLKRAAQVGVGALVVGTWAGVAAEVLLDRSRRPWDASSFPPPGRPKIAVVRARPSCEGAAVWACSSRWSCASAGRAG